MPLAWLVILAAVPRQVAVAAQEDRFETVWWDTLDANGRLTGGNVKMLRPVRDRNVGSAQAPCTTLTQSLLPVSTANRIDLVFVGDGYTSAELGNYANQVNSIAGTFFSKDPYLTYQPYFTTHRVDVASIDSGVDNDPTQGVQKNTALDMGFWCGNIDRLLCVDVTKAYAFANNAPDVDLVAALANSTTYGGAGYPGSDLATCAAGNGASLEIIRHEFGHALGNLADEYDYHDGTTYTGAEPSERDASKLTAAQMSSAGTKWTAWLGTNDASFDGLVSTYEGAVYKQFGVYRPTNNSLMRNLGRPFNLPSAESMVIEIYKIVKPIDASSSTSATYTGSETLFVTPMAPVAHPLDVQWYLGGAPIAGATGTTLNLATLGLGACPATISVKVVDNTTMVRDAAARAQWLTQTLTFAVNPGSPVFSTYCVTSPNSVGPGAQIAGSGSTSLSANQLQLQATGCPSDVSGIFFFGDTQAQVPLGNGFRCVGSPLVRLPVTTTNLFGDAVCSPNLANLPAGAVIHAGETKLFQLWYRDVQGGGAGNNLSNGLSVRFCP
jgi:hypothetical protein